MAKKAAKAKKAASSKGKKASPKGKRTTKKVFDPLGRGFRLLNK